VLGKIGLSHGPTSALPGLTKAFMQTAHHFNQQLPAVMINKISPMINSKIAFHANTHSATDKKSSDHCSVLGFFGHFRINFCSQVPSEAYCNASPAIRGTQNNSYYIRKRMSLQLAITRHLLLRVASQP